MKTNIKWQLSVLAAATLLVAGCDPFPAQTEGSPSVLRITTYNGSVSTTTDHVSTDPAGKITASLAQPDDTIFVQFNKPMDGTSIQKYADADPNITIDPDSVGTFDDPGYAGDPNSPQRDPYSDPGVPFPACTPSTSLLLGGFENIPAVKQTYTASGNEIVTEGSYPAYTQNCFMPSSSTDGGQIEIIPAVPLFYNVSYTLAGTVKDYQGNTLPIDVLVRVDGSEQLAVTDGYTARIRWFVQPVPGTMLLERSLDAGTTWATVDTTTVPPNCAAAANPNTCTVYDIAQQPGTTIQYRLSEGGVARPVVTDTIKLPSGRKPTLYPVTAPPATAAVPGEIKIKWSTVKSAVPGAYKLERSTDGGANWTVDATAQDCTTVAGACTVIDIGLTSATPYTYRVTPTYASGAIVNPGPVATMTAP